ncbi:hypothetical protein WJX79_004578 [Trebouxia sp. C0005]
MNGDEFELNATNVRRCKGKDHNVLYTLLVTSVHAKCDAQEQLQMVEKKLQEALQETEIAVALLSNLKKDKEDLYSKMAAVHQQLCDKAGRAQAEKFILSRDMQVLEDKLQNSESLIAMAEAAVGISRVEADAKSQMDKLYAEKKTLDEQLQQINKDLHEEKKTAQTAREEAEKQASDAKQEADDLLHSAKLHAADQIKTAQKAADELVLQAQQDADDRLLEAHRARDELRQAFDTEKKQHQLTADQLQSTEEAKAQAEQQQMQLQDELAGQKATEGRLRERLAKREARSLEKKQALAAAEQRASEYEGLLADAQLKFKSVAKHRKSAQKQLDAQEEDLEHLGHRLKAASPAVALPSPGSKLTSPSPRRTSRRDADLGLPTTAPAESPSPRHEPNQATGTPEGERAQAAEEAPKTWGQRLLGGFIFRSASKAPKQSSAGRSPGTPVSNMATTLAGLQPAAAAAPTSALGSFSQGTTQSQAPAALRPSGRKRKSAAAAKPAEALPVADALQAGRVGGGSPQVHQRGPSHASDASNDSNKRKADELQQVFVEYREAVHSPPKRHRLANATRASVEAAGDAAAQAVIDAAAAAPTAAEAAAAAEEANVAVAEAAHEVIAHAAPAKQAASGSNAPQIENGEASEGSKGAKIAGKASAATTATAAAEKPSAAETSTNAPTFGDDGEAASGQDGEQAPKGSKAGSKASGARANGGRARKQEAPTRVKQPAAAAVLALEPPEEAKKGARKRTSSSTTSGTAAKKARTSTQANSGAKNGSVRRTSGRTASKGTGGAGQGAPPALSTRSRKSSASADLSKMEDTAGTHGQDIKMPAIPEEDEEEADE